MAIDGAAVRILREKTGASRSQFASDLGISLQYLCDIEDGRRLVKRNPGLIKRIAGLLDVPTYMVEQRPDDEGAA